MGLLSKYSLQRRITIIASVLVFLPYMALSMVTLRYNINYAEEKKRQQYISLVHIVESTINRNLGHIESAVGALASTKSVKSALHGKNKNEMAISLLFDADEDVAKTAFLLRDLHAEISIITPNEELYERYGQFYRRSRFTDDREFMVFFDSGGMSLWLTPRKTTGEMPLYTSAQETVLPFCYKVINVSQSIGVVMCSVRLDDLFAPLYELSQYGTVEVSAEGVCIFRLEGPDEEAMGESLRFDVGISGYPYQILLKVPANGIDSSEQMVQSLVLLVSLYIILMLIIGKIISTLTRKLKLVSELLSMIDPNQDGQRIPHLGGSEMEHLGSAINKLLEKIDIQRHEILRSERDKQLAERYALQYQMNPHLLFNSLHWLKLKLPEDESETQLGIDLLAGIYRYNLNDEEFVSVENELKNVEAYIQMMRLMKSKGILLELDCPQELYEVRILRFMLQPMVENAIKHGIQRDESLRIAITFRHSGSMLMITVCNDGRPIPEDKLAELNAELAIPPRQQRDGSHIGLQNLAQRLYLTYGETSCVRLKMCKWGLSVVIRIPWEG